MCDIQGWLKKYSLYVLVLGLILFWAPIFLFPNYPLLVSLSIVIGIILFLGGVIGYVYSRLTEDNSIKVLYWFVVIFALIIWLIMSFSLLTPENIGSMLNTFITIDIAMLSIIFAVLAINSKHLLEVLKHNPNVDLNRFQGFILLSALSILGNLFIYVLNYIPQTTGSTSLDIFGITICVYLRKLHAWDNHIFHAHSRLSFCLLYFNNF